MAWARLDDQIFYNKKMAQVDALAKLLYVAGLVYAANQLTDGFLPQKALRFIANTADVPNHQEFTQQLLDVGLWEEAEDGYMIHDYLEWNPSRAQVERTRAARSAAGSRGGIAKKQNYDNLFGENVAKSWQNASKTLAKPKQNPGKTVAKPQQSSGEPEAKPEQNFSTSPATITSPSQKTDSKAQTDGKTTENGPENPENSNLVAEEQNAGNLPGKNVAKSWQNASKILAKPKQNRAPSPSPSVKADKEIKRDRDAETDTLSSSSSVYAPQLSTFHEAIGLVANAQQSEEIFAMLDKLAARDALGWWEQAFHIAADKNKRSWPFVRGILNNCLREGHAPQNGHNSPQPDKTLPTGKATIKIILDDEVVEQEIVTHG